MKKLLAIALILVMILTMAACGGNKKDIVGTWAIVDKETATDYGLGLEFTKDGKLYYTLTESEDVKEAWEEMEGLMTIEYKVKSDTEMEVTISAFLGLAKEITMIPDKLDGDNLTFDGADYVRVK